MRLGTRRIEHPLRGRRIIRQLACRTPRPRDEFPSAIRTLPFQHPSGAIRTKRAFERADPCIVGFRRQILVAALTSGPEIQHRFLRFYSYAVDVERVRSSATPHLMAESYRLHPPARPARPVISRQKAAFAAPTHAKSTPGQHHPPHGPTHRACDERKAQPQLAPHFIKRGIVREFTVEVEDRRDVLGTKPID